MGSSPSRLATRVVIVGGGYGGVELIKALDAKVNVTLIEVRKHSCVRRGHKQRPWNGERGT